MKRLIFLLFFSIGFHANTQLQFNHYAGGSLSFHIQSSYFNVMPVLSYNANLDYWLNDHLAFSLATYPSLVPLQFDGRPFVVPIAVQFYLGNSPFSYSRFWDFYAGFGVAPAMGPNYNTSYYPCFETGVKFGLDRFKALRFEVIRMDNSSPMFTQIGKFKQFINIGFLLNLPGEFDF